MIDRLCRSVLISLGTAEDSQMRGHGVARRREVTGDLAG
jgi:hypothetical protein